MFHSHDIGEFTVTTKEEEISDYTSQGVGTSQKRTCYRRSTREMEPDKVSVGILPGILYHGFALF